MSFGSPRPARVACSPPYPPTPVRVASLGSSGDKPSTHQQGSRDKLAFKHGSHAAGPPWSYVAQLPLLCTVALPHSPRPRGEARCRGYSAHHVPLSGSPVWASGHPSSPQFSPIRRFIWAAPRHARIHECGCGGPRPWVWVGATAWVGSQPNLEAQPWAQRAPRSAGRERLPCLGREGWWARNSRVL